MDINNRFNSAFLMPSLNIDIMVSETSNPLKYLAIFIQTYLETGIPKKWKRFTQKSQITSLILKKFFRSFLLILIGNIAS